MASDEWYYVRDGKSHSPVTWNALVQMARTGKLSANDQIWNESLPRWVSAGAVEGLIPSQPGAPYAYAEPGYEAAPRSWLGMISLLMGIFFCGVEMVMIAAAGLMEANTSGGLAENSPEAALLGLMLLGGGAGAFFGAILGLVAMFQDNANKIAAAFGLALNGMCVIGVVGLMLLGLLMGA
jgi:uncharacterized protein DUF4339